MLIHRLALFTAICTFALLLLGGIVHMTESGLACPAWPMCFPDQSELLPSGMEQKPTIEYSHRLVASTVGLLTLALAALTFRRRREQPGLWRMSLAAVPLVIFQGILGKITVEHELPTLVSTAHLATAMVYFALIVVLVYRSHPVGQGPRPRGVPRSARLLVTAALGAIYVQIVLGALVRHTAAGLACGTDPVLCAGVLLPSWAPGQLQMLHRVMALVVTGLVIVASSRARRGLDPSQRFLRGLALSTHGLVFVQVSLGVASVMTALDIPTVSAHMGVGVLLFMAFVLLWAALRVPRPGHDAVRRATPEPAITSSDPGEARAI